MRRVAETIGVLLFAIGVSAGDSENLLIPIALIAAGTLIYKLSARME